MYEPKIVEQEYRPFGVRVFRVNDSLLFGVVADAAGSHVFRGINWDADGYYYQASDFIADEFDAQAAITRSGA